jgi:membrane protease subunit HflK
MKRKLVIALAGLGTAALLLAASGFCLVTPDEVVVVRRLGRLVEPAWGPGLHWSWPLGIDRLDRARAREVRQLTIGLARPDSVDVEPSAGEFLTGDLNLLRAQATVQYRLGDPFDYVVRAQERERLLARSAEASLARALASRGVDAVLRSARQAIAREVRVDLQTRSDRHRLGIVILGVSFTDARPPYEVEADFAAAQSAESERDRRINDARSYAETTETTARAEAQALLENAHALAQRRLLLAQASAERFTLLMAEAQRARKLTIRRLYIESLQAMLDRVKRKIVLPPGDSLDVTVLGSKEEPAPQPGK